MIFDMNIAVLAVAEAGYRECVFGLQFLSEFHQIHEMAARHYYCASREFGQAGCTKRIAELAAQSPELLRSPIHRSPLHGICFSFFNNARTAAALAADAFLLAVEIDERGAFPAGTIISPRSRRAASNVKRIS